MSTDPKEWFRLLDLPPGASLDEVKRSYRELAKVWHPDRFAHDPSLLRTSQEKMKQLNHAYQQLSALLAENGAAAFARQTPPNAPQWSAGRRVAPPPHGAGPPPPPMAAMGKGGDGFTRLSWAPVYDLVNFNVKRSDVSGGTYTTIAPGIAWTEYVDRAVENGKRYYYVISSVDRSHESANSAEFTASPLPTPAPPTNLAATMGKGEGVHLKWKPSPNPEIVCHVVHRANAGSGDFEQIAQVSAGTRYQDKQGSADSTYVVTAMNSNAQQSTRSNEAAARRAQT
jgi:hypothetical protein